MTAPYQTQSLCIDEVTAPNRWNDLVHHFWQQTWEYGEIQEKNNRIVRRYTIYTPDNKKLLGYFQLVVYPGIGTQAIGYIPHGPNVDVDQWEDHMGPELQSALICIGRDLSCMYVRVEPQAELGIYNKRIIGLGIPIPRFAYRSSFNQPRGEAVTNLEFDEETLVKQLSKSTKRNIAKAKKNNLTCSFYYGTDMLGYCDEFIALNTTNTESHGTTTHTDTYFHTLFSTLSQHSDNFIARVLYEGEVCAINIFTVWGTEHNTYSFCPFGASNDTGKKLGAYYFVKWCSLVEMKQTIGSFNWGGVSLGYNDDNLRGVTTFKQGFESTSLDLGPLHDVVIQPLPYYSYLVYSYIKSFLKK